MDNINGVLKVVFLILAVGLALGLATFPKTNCQACHIDYEGEVINGNEAYEIFESACISYDKPWSQKEYAYIDIDNLNVSETDDGKLRIEITNITPQIIGYEESGFGDTKDSPHASRVVEE